MLVVERFEGHAFARRRFRASRNSQSDISTVVFMNGHPFGRKDLKAYGAPPVVAGQGMDLL
jgi:hypothetical protein